MSERNEVRESTFRVIRVFLASPSDLADERRIARAAVDEINKTVARPAGFHVDLIGWEDTLSAAGRPQEIINADIETCEMFIGMLWARWGTPPDNAGRFSSGFEEEFTLASGRHLSSGSPYLALLFKNVESTKLNDPGPELSKVLAFKSKVISEKRVLFDNFDDAIGIGERIRLLVASFIHKLRRLDRSVSANESPSEKAPEFVQVTSPGASVTEGEQRNAESLFLADVSVKLETNKTSLLPTDIARIRNVAAALATHENDDDPLGNHDANLMYLNRNEFELSSMEITALADASLAVWGDESRPLWSWLRNRMDAFECWLEYTSVFGPDRRRVGALRAMAVLRKSLKEDEVFQITKIGELWFGEQTPAAVKNAALDYIGTIGDSNLSVLAEAELGKNNYETQKGALEAVIQTRASQSVCNAAKFAVEASFNELSDAPLQSVLAGMREIESGFLVNALEHRSETIRAKAIELLAIRGEIPESQIRRFFGDSSLLVREASVQAFEATIRPLNEEEAKEALIIKETKSALNIGNSSFDTAGHEAFTKHKRARLRKLQSKELNSLFEDDVLEQDNYYFATVRSGTANALRVLRTDVDDRFVSFWKKHLNSITEKYGPGKSGDAVAQIVDKHADFRRRQLLRQALDILVEKSDAVDLPRFRRALDEDVVDPSFADIDYLARWGAWEDVSRVIKISSDYRASGAIGLLSIATADTNRPAKAIIRLSRGNANAVLASSMSASVLAKIVRQIPSSSFKKADKKVVECLLLSDSQMVRKAVALKILICWSTKDIKELLARHLKLGRKRYYNVTFWLDLCVSWDRDTYRSIAARELSRAF